MRLICAECERASEGRAQDWAAYLADIDDDGSDEVVCFCPDCSAREFGRT